MPMHQTIRKKRKELGFTQEQVAESLGVSAPAVNKWEKGGSFPDISLLPALCRLLQMDLNTLFDFHEELSDREILQFISSISQDIQESGYEHGFMQALETVRQYPSCGSLIHQTALMLDSALLLTGMNPKEKKPFESRILDLYERASRCGDEQTQLRASFMLASKYMALEQYSKAQELLERLPQRNLLDRQRMQASLFLKQNRLEDAATLLERRLLTQVNELQMILLDLTDVALKEENHREAARIAELSRKAAELFGLQGYYASLAPLQVAVFQKDAPSSIALLSSMLDCAQSLCELPVYPLYRHISAPMKPDHPNDLTAKILPPLLAELENSPRYNFLRENEEFRRLIRRYRDKC